MGAYFEDAQQINHANYTCGWCSAYVAPSSGWVGQDTGFGRESGAGHLVAITLCTSCTNPTYHWRGK